MRIFTVSVALLLILTAVLPFMDIGKSAGPADSPWPMYGADCRHSKLSPYSTAANNGTLLWTFDIDQSTTPSGAVIDSNGVIYVSDIVKGLYAINPNGSLKWRSDFDDGPGNPALSPDAKTLYIDCWDGDLYALDAATGQIKWNYSTESHIDCAPSVWSDGTIYFVSGDGKLYALNPDGELKWSFDTGTPLYRSSPAISDDGTVLFVGTNKMYAVSPDGNEKWSLNISTEGINKDISIGPDGTIYFGYLGELSVSGFIPGRLYAIDPNGSVKWTFSEDDAFGEPAIGPDGTVYITSHKGLYAISPDGDKKWLFEVQGSPPISPSLAIDKDGIIYYGASGLEPTVYSVNPDGSLRWQFKTPKRTENQFISPISIGETGSVSFGISGDGSVIYVIGNEASNGTAVDQGTTTYQILLYSLVLSGLVLVILATIWHRRRKSASEDTALEQEKKQT